MARLCSRAVAGRAASASPSSTAPRSGSPLPRSEALPKERRLAKRRDFLRVYETGRKLFARYCVLFFAENGLPHSRIGITATKKLGKATVRNRIKRWTREVYRRQREPLDLDRKPMDFVVNVKQNAAGSAFRDYSNDLQRVLARAAAESRG
jgi:ribonuclease P protein component